MQISYITNKEELWSQYSSLLPCLKDKKAEEDDSLKQNIKSAILSLYKGIYRLCAIYATMRMKIQSNEKYYLSAKSNLRNIIILPVNKFKKKNELEIGGQVA